MKHLPAQQRTGLVVARTATLVLCLMNAVTIISWIVEQFSHMPPWPITHIKHVSIGAEG